MIYAPLILIHIFLVHGKRCLCKLNLASFATFGKWCISDSLVWVMESYVKFTQLAYFPGRTIFLLYVRIICRHSLLVKRESLIAQFRFSILQKVHLNHVLFFWPRIISKHLRLSLVHTHPHIHIRTPLCEQYNLQCRTMFLGKLWIDNRQL